MEKSFILVSREWEKFTQEVWDTMQVFCYGLENSLFIILQKANEMFLNEANRFVSAGCISMLLEVVLQECAFLIRLLLFACTFNLVLEILRSSIRSRALACRTQDSPVLQQQHHGCQQLASWAFPTLPSKCAFWKAAHWIGSSIEHSYSACP